MDFLERNEKIFYNKPLKHILGIYIHYIREELPTLEKNYDKSIRELLVDGYNFITTMINFYPVLYDAQKFKDKFEKKLRYMEKRIEIFLNFPIGLSYDFDQELQEVPMKKRNIFDLNIIILKNIFKLFKIDMENIIFKPEIKITYKEYLEKLLNEEKFKPMKEEMVLKCQSINGTYILYDKLIKGLKDPLYKNDKIYPIFLYYYMLNTLLIYKFSIYESLFDLYINSVVFEKKLYREIKKDTGIQFETKMMDLFFRTVLNAFNSRLSKYKYFIEKIFKEIK